MSTILKYSDFYLIFIITYICTAVALDSVQIRVDLDCDNSTYSFDVTDNGFAAVVREELKKAFQMYGALSDESKQMTSLEAVNRLQEIYPSYHFAAVTGADEPDGLIGGNITRYSEKGMGTVIAAWRHSSTPWLKYDAAVRYQLQRELNYQVSTANHLAGENHRNALQALTSVNYGHWPVYACGDAVVEDQLVLDVSDVFWEVWLRNGTVVVVVLSNEAKFEVE